MAKQFSIKTADEDQSKVVFEEAEPQPDRVIVYTIPQCDERISHLDTVIAELQAEKALWELRKTEAQKL
jgi:uncharacterized small protein (DUF1192 family)